MGFEVMRFEVSEVFLLSSLVCYFSFRPFVFCIMSSACFRRVGNNISSLISGEQTYRQINPYRTGRAV